MALPALFEGSGPSFYILLFRSRQLGEIWHGATSIPYIICLFGVYCRTDLHILRTFGSLIGCKEYSLITNWVADKELKLSYHTGYIGFRV